MATQKEIQSAINVLTARLDQVKTSHHYTEEERIPLVENIENRINTLTADLIVVEPETI
ncbi:MAG: hypothetical protein ACSHXA_07400 [Polaribacter sp.]|uniref:hypothetical protein n=1 Tax=Polaribacter sp. TaxID=1920175 RepID=UPI003EFB25A9